MYLCDYMPLLTVEPAEPAAARYIFEIQRPAGVGDAALAPLAQHRQY